MCVRQYEQCHMAKSLQSNLSAVWVKIWNSSLKLPQNSNTKKTSLYCCVTLSFSTRIPNDTLLKLSGKSEILLLLSKSSSSTPTAAPQSLFPTTRTTSTSTENDNKNVLSSPLSRSLPHAMRSYIIPRYLKYNFIFELLAENSLLLRCWHSSPWNNTKKFPHCWVQFSKSSLCLLR